ncbi:YdcH family protein [bacterium]|nr:YdcH family protein [bacterium]
MKRKNPVTRLEILKERHRQLNDTVDEMSSRSILTPSDLLSLKGMKVQRLRLKDAISMLENNNMLMPNNFEVK